MPDNDNVEAVWSVPDTRHKLFRACPSDLTIGAFKSFEIEAARKFRENFYALQTGAALYEALEELSVAFINPSRVAVLEYIRQKWLVTPVHLFIEPVVTAYGLSFDEHEQQRLFALRPTAHQARVELLKSLTHPPPHRL